MKRTSGLTIVFIALIVLAPALYVLSTGPAVWLAARGVVDIDNGPCSVIYAPFPWVCDEFPAFQRGLTWYLHFWDPDTYELP